jgi:hypothetical protein
MTTPVTYKLGELCAWSVTPKAKLCNTVAHRYVDVSYVKPDGSILDQILELPETEAVHLCASMATDNSLHALVQESANKWYKPGGHCALPGVVQLVSKAASTQTKWLGSIECKYINIRVDMRSGHFCITDSQGQEASSKVFDLLDWPNGHKPG